MSLAAIRMLKRRWGLPDAAGPMLERFFTSWAAGHTSLELSTEEVDLLAQSAAVSDGSDDSSPAAWPALSSCTWPRNSTRWRPCGPV